MKRHLFGLLALAAGAATASAADDATLRRVRAAIQATAPGSMIESIQASPMPGVYHALVAGADVYVSADGKFLFAGSMWDVEGKRNLSEIGRAKRRAGALSGIGPDKRFVFAATAPRHTVTVFTDLDCGYCSKLHQQVALFNAAGISVEYLLLPRGGLDSPSFDKAVSVWCAADRNDALTRAKRGEQIAGKVCPNPVREEFELGVRLGVNTTPAVFSDDGRYLGGYLTVPQMLAALDTDGGAGH